MSFEIDHGTRCTEHVGEAFRVRCPRCDWLADHQRRRPTHYIPGSKCELHDGYPLPCDLCWRLETEESR